MIDAPTQSFVFLFTQWARVDLGPPSLIGQIWEPGSQKSRTTQSECFPTETRHRSFKTVGKRAHLRSAVECRTGRSQVQQVRYLHVEYRFFAVCPLVFLEFS